ncbi:MAG TPA: GAF domain-containing protein [Candidatus Sulfomarinibacteraceae bacterium]|nr:GAF domain-containing protein [Candidatus Sulfomarinibacteraceae bacterium]
MSPTLQVLILEDSDDDAAEIADALHGSNLNLYCQRVDNEIAFRRRLQEKVDLVIGSHRLASFDGRQVLHALQEHQLDVPFIIVTGAFDKEAVACVRQGAADCLLRSDLSRLGEAIRHAMHERRVESSLVQALTDIAATLNSTLDLNTVLDRILENVGRVVPHHGANIMLLENGVARVRRFRAYQVAYKMSPHILNHGFRVDEAETLQRMIATRRAIVIPDTRSYGPWISVDASWVRSYAGAPIVQNDEVIGFLNLDAAEPDFFNKEHAERLQAFADQVGVALRNAQLYKAEQRRRKIAETLTDAAAMLNATLALDEVLPRILQQLGQIIPYDSASVQELENGKLVVRAVKGFDEPDRFLEVTLPISAKLPNAEIMNSKRPLALPDVSAAYPAFGNVSEFGALPQIRSWLGVPLLLNSQVLGLITVDRRKVNPFSPEEVKLATILANHAASALHNARMYQALENYSEFLESAVAARTEELQQAVDQMQAILSHSAQAIILLDSLGRIQTGNPALNRLFGHDMEELLDRSPRLLVAEEDERRLVDALRRALSMGQSSQLQVIARRKDGSRFDADVALSPIHRDGKVVNVVCSIHDISGLKEVERMKDAFVSNVSHELRTPISSLKLYHGLLARSDRNHDHYMNRLEREIDRLSVIIEDLLRLSQLEQEGTDLQRTELDLAEIAAQYVLDRAPLAKKTGLQLKLDDDSPHPIVFADPGLLGQVLSIVLTNALTYTPAGGLVRVGVRCKEVKGRQWAGLYVSDSGPGIDPREKEHLFKRFFRGRAGRASGSAGTGLGLSIAQEIVRQHGGWIAVESSGQNGKGATFTVWLPLLAPDGSN